MDNNTEDFFKERGYAVTPSQEMGIPSSNDTIANALPTFDNMNPVDQLQQDLQSRQMDFVKKSIRQDAMKLSFADKQNIKQGSVQSILGGLKDNRLSLTEFDVDVDEVYTKLNDGTYIPKFDNYVSGTNNEQRLAQQQSGWEQALNGVTKGIAKTALNILDGTVGTVVGLSNGISEGSMASVYNNNFSQWIDDVNTKLDFQLPNYYTQEQKNMNFLESMGTTNFWANDFLGGMSFMLGTIGSEAIWAVATGGSSLATTLPRMTLKAGAVGLAKTVGKSSAREFYKNSLKILKAYNRTIPVSQGAKIFNNARFLYTSAGYEAGVEARHSLDESLESFIHSYESTLGRRPNVEEYSEFMKSAVDSSNSVFKANVALVGASNIAQFGSYFGVGTGVNKALSKVLGKTFGLGVTKTVDGTGKLVYEALKPSRLQRIVGNTLDVLKAPLIEGVIEEGGQGVITRTSKNWLASRFNPDALRDNYSLIESAGDAFSESYGTKEGFKEIGLGMLIGFVGGANRRGATGQRTPFNVGQYSSQVQANENLANNLNLADARMTTAQKNLLDRLVLTNQFNTFVNKSKKESDEGNLFQSSVDWDTAQYTKMLLESSADMLDDSVQDFTRVVEAMPSDELRNNYNLTDTQITDYKEALIGNYTENVSLFQQSSEIAEAVNPSGFDLGIDKKDFTQELGLNIYLGIKSAQRANEVADSIDELIGTNGIASALKLYTNLDKKAKRRAEKIVGLEDTITTLEQEYAVLEQEFANSNMNKPARTEANQQVSTKADVNQGRRDKVFKQLTKTRQELSDLQGKLENRFYKSKFAFGGNLNVFKDFSSDEALITDLDLRNSVLELKKLDTYKGLLREQNPKAAEALDTLLDEYLKNVKAFRDFNLVYEQMADPRFARDNYKGIFGLFKNQGASFDDSNYESSELDVTTQAFNTFMEVNKDNLSESQKFTLNTLHRMSTAFHLNLSIDNLVETVDSIDNEIWQEFNETQDVSDDIKNNIANKLSKGEILSEREQTIYESKELEINQIKDDLMLNMGDSLEVLTRPSTPKESEFTLVGRLKNIINSIKDSKQYLDNFEVGDIREEDIPTNKDYKDYNDLFQEQLNGNITPKKQERLNTLKTKINEWGKLEGTLVDKNITLADLMEQVIVLENQISSREDVLPSLIDLNDLLDDIDFKVIERGGNYDNLQSYDKVMVMKDNLGFFNISNINLNGILDIISKDLNFVVEKGGKILDKNKDYWDINSIEEGQRYVVKYEINGVTEKLILRIGRGNNILVGDDTKNKLNTLTSLKIAPSNNLPTNYQPLLRQVEIDGFMKLIPVDSNFTFEDNLKINNDAIFNLKPNDLLYLEVSTKDSYNKKLLNNYNKAEGIKKEEALKKLEESLVIYLKDKQNNFIGVHKKTGGIESLTDSNYIKLNEVRKLAVKRVLEENFMENQTLDLGMSIPVSRVYPGHPNLNIVDKNGKVFVEGIPFNDKSMESIQDIGYIEDGKVILKNDISDYSIYPYASNIVRDNKYKGKKVPVVVLKFNNNLLVYPVNLNSLEVDLSVQIDDLVSSNLSTQNKILELNKLIIQYDLDVNKNGFTFDNYNVEHLEQVKQLLTQKNDYFDVVKWFSDDITLEDILREQVNINIDLLNKPFHSPKVKTLISQVNGMDSSSLLDINIEENLNDEFIQDIRNVQDENC